MQNQPIKNKPSDNWYTPPHIVELVVQVLGKIDLDPCAEVGKKIPAREHYTINGDGLSQQWHGRVFLNPPYSSPGKWISKLTEEIITGRVIEAIALVPGATDTNWLSPVLQTQDVCFWKGRIKFLDTNYEPKLPARQSHILIYWGDNSARFKEVFEEYGVFKPSTYSNTYNRDNGQVLGENTSHSIPPSTPIEDDAQTIEDNLLSIASDGQLSNKSAVLGENISHSIPPSTPVEHDAQTVEDDILLSIASDGQLSNESAVLGENISHSIPPSTPVEHDAQTVEDDLLLSIVSDGQLSNKSGVLGENMSHSIPPSTPVEHDAQTVEDDILLSIASDGQLSNESGVLGENISHSISPSTPVEHDAQTVEDDILLSIASDGQLSNESGVLGENMSHSTSPSIHRKHGEGSGNLSWGYANANSKKKKPIKQLYFEWEYAGRRGKTYVRKHLQEEVIALNDAKAPVVEILELLTYNPKVTITLGIV